MKNAPGVPPTAVRPQHFTLRVQQWGDRTRYAIVDGQDDKVLALRTNRAEAENELIVLNMNRGRMNGENMNGEHVQPSGPSTSGEPETTDAPRLSAA
jgi:hypothetical protein